MSIGSVVMSPLFIFVSRLRGSRNQGLSYFFNTAPLNILPCIYRFTVSTDYEVLTWIPTVLFLISLHGSSWIIMGSSSKTVIVLSSQEPFYIAIEYSYVFKYVEASVQSLLSPGLLSFILSHLHKADKSLGSNIPQVLWVYLIFIAHLQIQHAQAGSVGTKLKVYSQLEAEVWECWKSGLSSEILLQLPSLLLEIPFSQTAVTEKKTISRKKSNKIQSTHSTNPIST